MLLETDKIILGKKFKQYRKNLGLTQFQLAELVGLNEKQISRIEAGQNYPTYITFAKLLDVLEIDISSFTDIETKNNSENNDNKNELLRLIKKSTNSELKLYADVIKSIRKNLSPTKW